jgi:spore germination protein KC
MVQTRPKARALIALCLFLTPLLVGCWDVMDLSDRAIVATMGFDVGEKAPIKVWLQVVRPAPEELRGERIPFVVLSAEADTVAHAIEKMDHQFVPRLFFGHAQFMLFSERLARQGMELVFDWTLTSPDRRPAQIMLVMHGEGLPQMMQRLAPDVGHSPTVVLTSMEPLIGHRSTLGQWFAARLEQGRDPALGSLLMPPRRTAANKMSLYVAGGPALFKAGKLVDFLTPAQRRPFFLLSGDATRSDEVIMVENVGGALRAEYEWDACRITRRAELVNGRPVLKVRVQVRGRLIALARGKDPYNRSMIDQIERAMEQRLAAEMQAVHARLQSLGVDAAAVGRQFHQDQVAYWHRVQRTWYDRAFKDVQLVVDAQVRVETAGLQTRLVPDDRDQPRQDGRY